jgi:hypothetical protein
MVQTVTTKAVKRIITKGLTGWEVGKLVLQDFIDTYYRRDSVLTDTDIAAIRNMPMEGPDVRDYNMFMALCRGFHVGHMLGEWTCSDACLEIIYFDRILQNVNKRRIVELFESCGPRVVTRKQYEEIVVAQREKKLKFEYSLGYVIVSRQQKWHRLRHLVRGEAQLSPQEVMNLVDMLYITGKQLYECQKLPEWKDYIEKYDQYLFGDEDERFGHVYAVLEDYSGVWVDEQDYYTGPPKPSELITRNTELLLGLITHDDKAKKSIKSVVIELKDKLDTAEQNIRMFLAIKAILDTAAEAIGLDIPGDKGMLFAPNIRLSANIDIYNFRLEELQEKRLSWESSETRLDKALKLLPAIDIEKLKPSPDSLKQLKDNILKYAKGEVWLRTKLLSIECGDGFSFKKIWNE